MAIVVENKLVSLVDPSTAGGRLSVDATDPVGEGTNATLYYLPYVGNLIAIYDGGSWIAREFSAPSLDVSALTADQVYDVFGYLSGGALALEAVAWSNHGAGTGARATAIVQQDGVWVKSGDATRRYLGAIRTVDDSGVKARDITQWRYVDNAQNCVPYRDRSSDATGSWSPSGTNGSWADVNGGNAAWRHRFVAGRASPRLSRARVNFSRSGSDETYYFGVAVNGATAPQSQSWGWAGASLVIDMTTQARLEILGYSYFQARETTGGAGSSPPVSGGVFCDMAVEGAR